MALTRRTLLSLPVAVPLLNLAPRTNHVVGTCQPFSRRIVTEGVYPGISARSLSPQRSAHGRDSTGQLTPRDTWTPHPFNQFVDGPISGDVGVRRALEMVVASAIA